MQLANTLQQDTLPAYVELFELDATNIGGNLHRFTTGAPVTFGGHIYQTIQIDFGGLSQTSDGKQPRPQMSISNVNKLLLASVISLGDLVGAKLTRKRTFAPYLDDGETPDPTAFIEDVFYVMQKTVQSPSIITFDLCGALELTELKIPGRQITKKNFPAVAGNIR